MEVIDKDWIKARLTGRRGELAELARATGLSNDKLSKILKGDRKVQVEDVPGILNFFGFTPPVDTKEADLVQAVADLPDHLRQEALRYIEFLKSRG